MRIPFFEFIQYENIFLVLHHRNHLSIMSSSALIENNGIFNYDFTDSWLKTFGGLNGCAKLNSESYGMSAGDANGDGEVNNLDKNDFWFSQLGGSGYLQSDFNFDGEVDTDDLLFWIMNSGKSSQVPEQ